MRRHMDIGRANLYEQVGRQAGLRIQVVIAGACNAEQSTFIYGDVCVSRHVRLVKFRFDQSESTVFSFVDYIYFVGLSIAKYEIGRASCRERV